MALKTGLNDRTKMTLSAAALKDRKTTGPWRNPVVILSLRILLLILSLTILQILVPRDIGLHREHHP